MKYITAFFYGTVCSSVFFIFFFGLFRSQTNLDPRLMNCSSSGPWKRRCSCTDLRVCFWGWRHFRFHLIDHGYVSALPTSPSLACRAVWTLSLSPVLRVLSCFSDSYTILPHARSCSCRGLELSLGLLFKKKKKKVEREHRQHGTGRLMACAFSFSIWFCCSGALERASPKSNIMKCTRGNYKWNYYTFDPPHAVNLFRWNSAKVDIQASKTILGGLDPFITISRDFTEVCVFSSYHPLSTLCRQQQYFGRC